MFALAGLIALRAGSTQAQTSSARSAYTPLFSGVFWSVQDTVLEDIDRIESSTVIF